MEIASQPLLRFRGVDFPSVIFNCQQPSIDKNLEVDLEIVPRVFLAEENDRIFKVIMEVKARIDGFFDLAVVAVGSFELGDEVTGDQRKNFVNQNATAIMFPYVRSFITNLTANLGKVTGPIILPTKFFKGEIEQVKDAVSPALLKQ